MMLRHKAFEEARASNALEMLIIDRKNEFRTLSDAILKNVSISTMSKQQKGLFVLNFCLDVVKSFAEWSGKSELAPNSEKQTMVILRQLAKDQTSMNELTHLLNIAYSLAEEFKVVYKRIQ